MTSSLRMYSIDWETKLKRKNFGGSVWNMHDSDLVEGWQSLKLPAKVTRWVAVSTSNLLGGCGGEAGRMNSFLPLRRKPYMISMSCFFSAYLCTLMFSTPSDMLLHTQSKISCSPHQRTLYFPSGNQQKELQKDNV